jgi:hypothetical protein
MNHEDLIDRFEYRDGELFYKKSEGPMKKGAKVGTKIERGYIRTHIKRKPTLVHRIIFMMHHGYLPEMLDHIDGNPSNNRIENLRSVTCSQNNLNRGKHKRNTSQYKGVTWVARIKKYSTRIAIDGKRFFLGYFDDPQKAHKAYCDFAQQTQPEYIKTQ